MSAATATRPDSAIGLRLVEAADEARRQLERAGGQGPMITFVDEPRVHQLVRSFYEAGKVTALVCHATSVLLKTTLSDGTLLVTGKTWTGFADSEEDYADDYVGQRIQPFRIEQEARSLEGTNFVVNKEVEARRAAALPRVRATWYSIAVPASLASASGFACRKENVSASSRTRKGILNQHAIARAASGSSADQPLRH